MVLLVRPWPCLALPGPDNVLTVSIEVVEDGHAGLLLPALLGLLPVVWLGPARPPGVAPVSELRPVGWAHLHLVGGPEPPVDVLGEEVGTVAAVEVAQTPGGPEVGHIHCKHGVD